MGVEKTSKKANYPETPVTKVRFKMGNTEVEVETNERFEVEKEGLAFCAVVAQQMLRNVREENGKIWYDFPEIKSSGIFNVADTPS